MRVRISYTVEVSDDLRRGINEWYGRAGLASREEVQRWYKANGESMDMDLVAWPTRGQDEEEE